MSDPSNVVANALAMRFADLCSTHHGLSREIAAAQARLEILEGRRRETWRDAQSMHSAAKQLNIDLIAVLEELYRQANTPAENRPDLIPFEAVQSAIPAEGTATIREFALAQAKAAFPQPVRASELRKQLEADGRPTHEKTVGMTLYRLLREGHLRREGHNWFFLPPSAGTKNPGASPPGQKTIFD